MPDEAYMYALPYELYEKYAIRRYGFHGTSHRYAQSPNHWTSREFPEKSGFWWYLVKPVEKNLQVEPLFIYLSW